ncbi:MAG: Rdx family protein [Acidobacteriota bacterium]|nr:Rdx family protein [Acidobacteriota bacterium]
MPKASSLAASIKDAVGVDAEVVVGSRGQFDVVADGDIVFSKQAEERFPEPNEIITALQARRDAPA